MKDITYIGLNLSKLKIVTWSAVGRQTEHRDASTVHYAQGCICQIFTGGVRVSTGYD